MLLHEVVHATSRYADHLLRTEYGSTFSDFEYVATIADLDNRPDVTELAACLQVTKAAVSKRLPQLEAKGLTMRASDPHHGRRVLITLTPRGQELADKAGGRLEEVFNSLFTSQSENRSDPDNDIDRHRFHHDLVTLLARLHNLEFPL